MAEHSGGVGAGSDTTAHTAGAAQKRVSSGVGASLHHHPNGRDRACEAKSPCTDPVGQR